MYQPFSLSEETPTLEETASDKTFLTCNYFLSESFRKRTVPW